ncbi:MAG: hypothetical protein ABIJ41_06315 [Candidatus Omnitrophota bacterium]
MMNKKLIFLLIIIFILCFSGLVLADKEAPNSVYIKSSEYGSLYAKSIPDEPYGSKGKTLIYSVNPKDGAEQLITTYDWYSQEIYLLHTGALVRIGPWAGGRKANKEDFAIGFYNGGLTRKEYSTLDIAGREDNVWASVSHYRVFKKILGFRIEGGDDAILDNEYFVFEAETIDGRKLAFDFNTGEIQAAQTPIMNH